MTSQSPASAGDLVVRIVRSAADDLDQTRAGMLEDVPDGLHQHRTRVRRLRTYPLLCHSVWVACHPHHAPPNSHPLSHPMTDNGYSPTRGYHF